MSANVAGHNGFLNDENMRSLATVLKPEVVSSIYELNAQSNVLSGKAESMSMFEAVFAGVAGAAEVVKDYLEGRRADDKKCGRSEATVDDSYFDVKVK